MHRLTVRLLGGFDVRWDGQPVLGFESQKVRALFAYLVVKAGAAVPRDHLAGLLWTDRGNEAARRNLRQALYNLRATFPNGDCGEVVVADHQSVGLSPTADCWLDVAAFEEALGAGLAGEGSDPQQLAVASRLYSGDFLSGLLLRDSPAFEEWLVNEQDRLREGAIEAIGRLVEAYLARSEHRVGIQYALRLVAIDPLSEEAHRSLMRLYALSGRRTRALAQYEELRKLLNGELGVEPADETVALYRSILHGETLRAGEEDDRPLAPVIPLVGRAEAFDILGDSWREVQRGHGRLTVIEGEAGVGKSRLAASFVDGVTSRGRALVLRARSERRSSGVSFELFAESLGDLLAADPTLVERTLTKAPESLRRAVKSLLLASPETLGPAADPAMLEVPDRATLFAAVRQVLLALTGLPRMRGQGSVILLLDDLESADEPTLALLRQIVADRIDAPLWILATCGPPSHPGGLDELFAAAGRTGRFDRLSIGRLADEAMTEIAVSLVPREQVSELASLLGELSGGRPLAIVELINHLWDEAVLEPDGMTGWRLSRPLEGELRAPFGSLDDLVLRRVRRLPTSVRRLLFLAAVCGPRFDARLLCVAGDEHAAIVDAALELLLERWLLRKSLTSWSQPERQSDLALWASDGRAGHFELAHPAIRDALLRRLDAGRLRVLHRQVASALESIHSDDPDRICEALIDHLEAAGERSRLLPYLVTAAERAWAVRGDENARELCRRARELVAEVRADGAADAAEITALVERIDALGELVDVAGPRA